jgi:hypothetical protein
MRNVIHFTAIALAAAALLSLAACDSTKPTPPTGASGTSPSSDRAADDPTATRATGGRQHGATTGTDHTPADEPNADNRPAKTTGP